jgi:hypothetical protein
LAAVEVTDGGSETGSEAGGATTRGAGDSTFVTGGFTVDCVTGGGGGSTTCCVCGGDSTLGATCSGAGAFGGACCGGASISSGACTFGSGAGAIVVTT